MPTTLCAQNALFHLQLLLLTVHEPLLHAPLLDEPVDVDSALLADAMCPVDGLVIYVRVPVLVEEHDVVGARQVQAEAASARPDEVDKVVLVGAVEVAHVQLTQHPACASVKAQGAPSAPPAEGLQRVEACVELREDEDLVRPWCVPLIVCIGTPHSCSCLSDAEPSTRRSRGCARLWPPRAHLTQEEEAITAAETCLGERLRSPSELLLAFIEGTSPVGAKLHVLSMEVAQELVQESELAALGQHFFTHGLWPRSQLVEHRGVGSASRNPGVNPREVDALGVATQLPQPRYELQERTEALPRLLCPVPHDHPVPCCLAWAQRKPHIAQDLWGQDGHVLLLPPQHQQREQAPHPPHQGHPARCARLALVARVPLHQALRGTGGGQLQALLASVKYAHQHIGPEEAEQCKELLQVVLQRRAREQQPTRTLHGVKNLAYTRGLVLDPVSLVQHQHCPDVPTEKVLCRHQSLVGGDDNVLRSIPDLVVLEAVHAFSRGAADPRHTQVRHKALRFASPVPSATERRNDEAGTPHCTRREEVADACQRLQCLPKAHVVCEDATATVVEGVNQPIHTQCLVVP
mmetsp:Transcript_48435/g.154678  ORF Transcript_48435/g.154678 Transcript_48435/m.154678 type:complete len:577 (+) Transcript_48435:2081-3811(+)